MSVYHTRDSYVEALFEGIILLPRRHISAELRQPTFSFVPSDSRRRLIKHTKYHFLARRLRELAHLSHSSSHVYIDAPEKVAATRTPSTAPFEQRSEIRLRQDILSAYCDEHRFAAIWVTDSYRFSERAPEEYDLDIGRKDISGDGFCYFHHFGACDHVARFRMRSVSLLCGKRLVIPSAS